MEREKNEQRANTDLLLIYPLIPYKWQFYIEENFNEEEKMFKKEIEQKKQELLEAAGGDKKKMDFDIKRDCFEENCLDFVFDLEIVKRNKTGDILPKEKKTDMYIDE